MRIYATYNIKGGVGKTTTAVNLAYLSAADGCRTLLWDLDPQGAASFLFRIKPRVQGGGKALIRGTKALDDAIKGTDFDDLDLIPADFTYRNMDLILGGKDKKTTRQIAQLLRPLAAEYDHVFLDCPPSISLVSESVFEAADALLIPLLPAALSARTLNHIDDVARDGSAKLPFFSMVDSRKRMHRDLMESFAAQRPEMLRTVVPLAADVERMGQARAPLEEFAPRGAAASAFRELWKEIRERLRG